MRSAMERVTPVLAVNGKVISECSLYSPPNRNYILNSLKFCCSAVWNHSHCIWYSAWVLLFLCVLASTQSIRAVAFSLCLTKMGLSYCMEINAESGTKPMTNSEFLVALGMLFPSWWMSQGWDLGISQILLLTCIVTSAKPAPECHFLHNGKGCSAFRNCSALGKQGAILKKNPTNQPTCFS